MNAEILGRTEDYEWFIKTDLSRYSDEWIAILGKKVIAHDKEIKNLVKKIKNMSSQRKPSLVKISNTHRILLIC